LDKSFSDVETESVDTLATDAESPVSVEIVNVGEEPVSVVIAVFAEKTVSVVNAAVAEGPISVIIDAFDEKIVFIVNADVVEGPAVSIIFDATGISFQLYYGGIKGSHKESDVDHPLSI